MKSRVVVLFLAVPLAFAAGHRVVQIIPLPGENGSGALLVDAAARRLYVGQNNRLLVLDIESGRQLAAIDDLPAIAGIAVAPSIDRGYVTSSTDNRVSIFALSNFGHLGQIALGADPEALVYDSTAHRFYAMNRGSKNASAIDADDGEVEETIDLGGRPAGAVANDHGRVFVALEDRSEIVEIDAKRMAFSRRWPIPDCEAPHGLALDDSRNRLFIGCAKQRLAIVNANEGTVIGIAATGRGGGDIATDPSSGFVYLANTDGSITVFSEASTGKYETIETVPTQQGATALAFDSRTHQLFTLVPSHGAARPAGNEERERPSTSQLLVIGR